MKILAAEDNLLNQFVLEQLLAPLSPDLTFAGDGREAIELLEKFKFDVVLMDVQMPIMDGVEAVKEIRKNEATHALNRIPIIALTANVMAHQIDEYFTAGFDDFVSKPINEDDLFEALKKVSNAG